MEEAKTINPESETTEEVTTTEEVIKDDGGEELSEDAKLLKNREAELGRKNELLKQQEAELAEFKAKEAKILEQEKLKKGKYEEVIGEKNTLIADLEKDALSWREYQSKKEKEIQTNLESIKTELWEEVINQESFILDDLSPEKQLVYLEKIKGVNTPKDFTTKTNWDKKPNELGSKFEQTKANKGTSTQMMWSAFADMFWTNK